ncbi:hypothetical protein [Porphyromonas gulae]|uniref:hypothetical protein n=1 Tax=Porphyromonas gulae TaxID=111105 RepID=UPI000AF0B4D3|nr:hypothetical protein [Porphyromonas gulae]
MEYADKQLVVYLLQVEFTLFYSLSEHTPVEGRATPYGYLTYAVERAGLRSTALRATL